MSLNPFTFPESETSEKLDVQEATEFSKDIFRLLTEKFPNNTEVGHFSNNGEELDYAFLRATIGEGPFNTFEFGIDFEQFPTIPELKTPINSLHFYASRIAPHLDIMTELKLSPWEFPTCDVYIVPLDSKSASGLKSPDLKHLGSFKDNTGMVQQVYINGDMEIVDAVKLIESVATDNVTPFKDWNNSKTYTEYKKGLQDSQ